MKLILFISLLGFIQSSAFAATATKLSCPMRENVVISRFSHNLSTMKWDDHFLVASGVKKTKTRNDVPFRVTSFQNGDDLVFFPEKQQYYLFYSGNPNPDRCTIQSTSTYEITQLPRYEKPDT
ncbi:MULTISPECIES: hypothetical protein [Buttiauxella]|jgi:hypothetical protein|uniref:Uncharacterized protein n=1 Tax=Buttiauxella ferragutiae ATCC 51602 TaxID=1354252 RepID=A0ABX2W444_9ENTR|nr:MULTISPECIES: hypothetical protein [Buttiauxella]MCE0827202.1 hypothetical protein [Buttiauxella ferragutiae]OAT25405.1 hypothetical protein M976_03749 [Buttiauxella ferragutiae ATCC 51602]TDN51087.1 hypothetical protein EC843_10498 [Buttiauxella sp. JUb87]UNK59712.1 hypothetical protein MNO13_15065 [Buttiauxella ferragutiae]